VPEYAPGDEIPALDKVSSRIEGDLCWSGSVNVLFYGWLANLPQQGDVEVLDPAVRSPCSSGRTGKEAHERA